MAKINNNTRNIIRNLKNGKTQWEVHKMGYPFGTVRYHYQRLFKPKEFEKFMQKHKERMKKRYVPKPRKLSTSKGKK